MLKLRTCTRHPFVPWPSRPFVPGPPGVGGRTLTESLPKGKRALPKLGGLTDDRPYFVATISIIQ